MTSRGNAAAKAAAGQTGSDSGGGPLLILVAGVLSVAVAGAVFLARARRTAGRAPQH